MKKLLFAFILSPLLLADEVCDVYPENIFFLENEIENRNCKENDILFINVAKYYEYKVEDLHLAKASLVDIASRWCKFDKNTLIEGFALSCVLNSNQKRRLRD